MHGELLDGVDVGRHARLHRVIVDKGVRLPAGIELGLDAEADRARGFVVEDGLTVLAKGQQVDS